MGLIRRNAPPADQSKLLAEAESKTFVELVHRFFETGIGHASITTPTEIGDLNDLKARPQFRQETASSRELLLAPAEASGGGIETEGFPLQELYVVPRLKKQSLLLFEAGSGNCRKTLCQRSFAPPPDERRSTHFADDKQSR